MAKKNSANELAEELSAGLGFATLLGLGMLISHGDLRTMLIVAFTLTLAGTFIKLVYQIIKMKKSA